MPVVVVVVRNLGEETGPGREDPAGPVITAEHAIETAWLFGADLVR